MGWRPHICVTGSGSISPFLGPGKGENIKMDLKKSGQEYGLDLSGSRWGPAAGPCEHGNKPSLCLKFW